MTKINVTNVVTDCVTYSPITDMDIDVASDVTANVAADIIADVAFLRARDPHVIGSILELGH